MCSKHWDSFQKKPQRAFQGIWRHWDARAFPETDCELLGKIQPEPLLLKLTLTDSQGSMASDTLKQEMLKIQGTWEHRDCEEILPLSLKASCQLGNAYRLRKATLGFYRSGLWRNPLTAVKGPLFLYAHLTCLCLSFWNHSYVICGFTFFGSNT